MRRTLLLAFVVLAARASFTFAGEAPNPAARMADVAKAFLDTLDDAGKAKAVFEFNDDERVNWHFIPKDDTRKGLTLKDMKRPQRQAANKLLRAGLSQLGIKKARQVRTLEGILRKMEGAGGRFSRHPMLYHFSIFGKPSATGTWGWRYEGHHISLSVTVVKGVVVATSPQFFGSNPAEVREEGEHKGLRVLAAEEDRARELLALLSDEQKKKAILADKAPADILTKADTQAKPQDDKGISHRELNPEQRAALMKLIRVYTAAQPKPLAQKRLAAIREAGLGTVKFAWMGSTERGKGHYYRVQGKTFLIEYDNTQNGANHVHAVWRDFKGDFGRDLIAAHYRLYHNPVAAADREAAQLAGNPSLLGRLERLGGRQNQGSN